MTNTPIGFRVEDGVAWLTLDRPENRNALGPELAEALHAMADRCADDPTVRCVVLTGSGRFFCVGGDIAVFAQTGGDIEATVLKLARSFHAGILRLATMAKPLVVAVNGPAAGAGFSLALLGDIVIAADTAHFTAAYTAIGLTPDGGLSWWLPRLVGFRQAQDILLTNRRIDAGEAVHIGLITRVVPEGELEAAARETALALAAGPSAALARCRGLLLSAITTPLDAQLDAEAASIAAASAGAEGREGVAAFLAKRPPVFPSE
ncbi:enoyl-CoA hydratase [Sphingomonas panacis]|uniref:Enoyl-CoA hydratase n=1 Tax=Sphingomonas panacis TaxID=1560345 RepID=A0A1B3Z5K0_9SPHN|nr:enoyl-CoA hydratase-related protein [Sphingomonas panacis]AOH82702.1 enoyl-CoA hydratase [Sphingomonas panacis]